mmetsp:Transcript_9019/g.25358  ORF Transcript_9019/g.25358 Transcript_9019/m.25358 type:complete len:217 (-) Transcript_9019:754-1404(-)
MLWSSSFCMPSRSRTVLSSTSPTEEIRPGRLRSKASIIEMAAPLPATMRPLLSEGLSGLCAMPQRTLHNCVDSAVFPAHACMLPAALEAQTPHFDSNSTRSSTATSGMGTSAVCDEVILLTISTTRLGILNRMTSPNSFSSRAAAGSSPFPPAPAPAAAATRLASSSESHIISSPSSTSWYSPLLPTPLPAQRLAATSTASLSGRHDALHASTARS